MEIHGKKRRCKKIYTPRRHDPSRQLWRDFPVLLRKVKIVDTVRGILSWLSRLKEKDLIKSSHFIFT